METKIVIADRMVYGSKCLAKKDDENIKDIFIQGALPGEKVEIEIIATKKDYDEAKVVNIIEKSKYRVDPKCKYWGKCGGCNLQFAEDSYQQELRKNILQDIFIRAKCQNIPEIQVVSDSSWNYRNRFQFHNGGLMENMSNNSLKIDNCPVASDEINFFLKDEKTQNNPTFLYADRYFVFGANDCLKGAILEKKVDNKIVGKSKNKKIKTGGKRKIYEGSMIDPNSLFSINIKDKTVYFDVKGFFQSNVKMLEKTIDILKKDFYGENLLDMYSGVGTFSLFLSEQFKNICLVEHNRDAITIGEINLAKTSHESYGISGEKWIEQASNKHFDAVVIDPPRSGIERSVLTWLGQSDIPQIRSVSCDPVTHARDISYLQNHGYSIKQLYLLDYYPQTSHIESLAILEKV